MPTSLRLRVSVLYDYACLVAATATTATTSLVAFVVMVMVAATAAVTIMSAEELLDLLGRSIVDFLDSADEVEVFAC